MLDRAREKCTVDFRQDALPSLAVTGRYGVVVAIRGVINHLAPSALEWQSLTFTPDGEPIRNTQSMTPFTDERIATTAKETASRVTRRDGEGDDRTVVLASQR